MLLVGLLKGLALIVAAGGAGLAIGYGLSRLSGNDEPASPVDAGVATTATGAGTPTATTRTTPTSTTPRGTSTTTSTSTTPATSTTTTPTQTQTTTTPRPTGALAEVDVRVLGAVLRPAGAPSGVTPQDGEIVMRIRAQNRGSTSATIAAPVLRIGSTRTEVAPGGSAATGSFGSLAAGATKAVTVRFQITGDATPKATRDRRARIEIAGRSEPLRIKVQAP